MAVSLKEPSAGYYTQIYGDRFKPNVVYWADDMAREMSLSEYIDSRTFAQSQGDVFERIIMLDDTPIGTITARDFFPETGECTLGIVIVYPRYWGHGYGTAAIRLFLPMLRDYGVKVVLLDTYANNRRAQKSFMHAGFRKIRVFFSPNTGRFVVQMARRL